MNRLFIDANIYLRFYDNSQPDYKKLLGAIVEVKQDIFITQQIVDEVNRQKLSVFETSCNNILSGKLLKSRRLPEHFDPEGQSLIKDWNAEKEKLAKNCEMLIKEQGKIFNKLISEISRSVDKVSIELNSIFSKAIVPNGEQYSRAIERKRIGNPPGKAQDPLGDQISWEQLLDNLAGVDNIWIITNDTDYFSSYEEECFLNAFLFKEIMGQEKKNINIRCFNQLSIGLKNYNQLLKKLINLPGDNELDKISKLEMLPSITGSVTGSVVSSHSSVRAHDQCPRCGSISTFSPYIRYVGTGAFSSTYVCQTCGNQWEVMTVTE